MENWEKPLHQNNNERRIKMPEKDNSISAIIKHLIYRLVLPIYLWSINEKSLDSYMEHIKESYNGKNWC